MGKFWNFINRSEKESDLYIQGEIVGNSEAELLKWFSNDFTAPNAFKSELDSLGGKDINVYIDSYGGDVFAAAAIYTMLKAYGGNVTVKISGIAASAASVIAMAGNKVLMSAPAVMMIHNPSTYAEGDHNDMRRAEESLKAVKESIINAYQAKTGLTREKISTLMEKETFMDVNQAMELGFCDGKLEDSKLFDDAFIQNSINQRVVIYNSLKKRVNLAEQTDEREKVKETRKRQAKLALLDLDIEILKIKGE